MFPFGKVLAGDPFSFCPFRNAEDPLQRCPLEDQTPLHGGRLHHGLQLAAQPEPTQHQPKPAAAHGCHQRHAHPQAHTHRPTPKGRLRDSDTQRKKQSGQHSTYMLGKRVQQLTLAAGGRCTHAGTSPDRQKPTRLPGRRTPSGQLPSFLLSLFTQASEPKLTSELHSK